MDEKGQALVELAISFVVILLLLAGTVETGMMLFEFIQLRDAAQEGALYGSVCPAHLNEIENRVRYSSNSPLDLTDPKVQVDIVLLENDTTPISVADSGNSVKVTVSYTHRMFMPFFTGREIRLRSQVIDTVLKKDDCQ